MISSLLAAVDSSAYARSVREHTAALGKAYQARVTGLYVLDVRYMEMPPYVDYSYTFEAVPAAIAPVDVMQNFRDKSGRVLSDLAAFMGEAGVPAETRAEEGVPGQVIPEAGRAFDLIVMGKRGEHAKWGKGLLGSTAESVARRSVTPVLMVEPEYRQLNTALVLFDGSGPANRGLRMAADLAACTGLILRVLTADDDSARGQATQAQASAYLGPLGLQAEYVLLPGRAAKAASGWLSRYPADVVIMGMRGHSVLHDLLLGRTAEQLMRSVVVPVLLVP